VTAARRVLVLLARAAARFDLLLTCLAAAGSACASQANLSPEPDEELSGGDTTVFDTSRDAYSRPAANLRQEHRDGFFTGNAFFKRNWVTAPASTEGTDGLGPTFNARSCSDCHFKDGRGAPPESGETFSGLLVRLSVAGADDHGGPKPEPSYGGQFNPLAINGVPNEGVVTVEYEALAGQFADGEPYALLSPSYHFPELSFGPMAEDAMISPRVAPSVFGLGLLAALSEETLASLADPDDDDDDGISGRLNQVWDPKSGSIQIGRFGWKANQAGLEQQNVGALLGDIGITSALHPGQDCPPAQSACLSAEHGGEPEIDQQKIDFLVAYANLLAVPARRDVGEPEVLRGKALFARFGCASCHVPRLETGELPGFPEVSGQTIRPYTDLLLHDMGEGLADERPDFLADGREWRTPPLWGLGLSETVNRHTRLLHDGRARDVSEAILWHGGEAEAAQAAFLAASARERAQLIRFLNSL
jgi:CxxC motif-containing protein (DUF1111 family)